MYNIKTVEPTIKYYDLVMTLDNLNNINEYPLHEGFYFKFWNDCKEIKDWIDIHISTGEFNQYKEATDTFKNFYGDSLPKLNRRLIFICDKTGNKVATATLSPHIEGDYKVVIDWFAIKKEFQGKKLSKPLLYKVVQIAKELGYDKILLHTQTNSWLAAKIYIDFGFMPYNINKKEGWEILQTLINHTKLKIFNTIAESDIYDELMLNIKNQLSKIYQNFNFNVWYINGRNDIYLNSDNNFYEYKFYDNGNKIVKIK